MVLLVQYAKDTHKTTNLITQPLPYGPGEPIGKAFTPAIPC